ncbi:MAG: oligosaccharide flippase family protein [Candidatus Hodarchaeota archaeon]
MEERKSHQKEERARGIDQEWQSIGFHRPLAGVFYNVILVFIVAGLGMLFNVWLIPNVIFPFPEGMGYQSLLSSMLGIYFMLADFGVALALQRYISEKNVSDPKSTIKYISFFIWYQMFSGLIQVTIIAIWCLSFLPSSNLSYTSWFFLIYSTVQYPGMLWVFLGSLQGYQRLDKANLLSFLQMFVFENSSRIACILLGRWLGSHNPILGEVMGATLGSVIGVYIDDFIAAVVGSRWLTPVLKKIDPKIRIRDLFIPRIEKKVAKDCFFYGLRVTFPTLIFPLANYIAVNMYTAWLPNYSVFLGVYELADLISSLVASFSFSMAPPISEAYNNKKIVLTKDYIARNYKWSGLTGSFMMGLLLGGSSLLGNIMGESFSSISLMIQYLAVFKFVDLFAIVHDQTFNGLGHPEYNIILVGIDQIVRIVVLFLMLVVWPSGWQALVWALGLGRAVKWVVGIIILYLKFFPFKVNFWQTFIAPLFSTAAEILVILAFIWWLLPVLESISDLITASLVIICMAIVIGPFFVHLPIYALLGGWDERSLAIFERAVNMSGPSKGLSRFIFNISKKFSMLSPLYNKYPIKVAGVDQEIKELQELRMLKIASGNKQD